jgi:light-regulated signal transduction histidine kinase (bacteriophytochrome)
VVRETLDLEQLVNEVVDGLKFNEGVNRIEFKLHVPNGTKIITDPVRLRMVLNNLVSNAVRYHDKLKEKQFIEIDYRSGNPHVEISVKDNGQGIRPEHLEKNLRYVLQNSLQHRWLGFGLIHCTRSSRTHGRKYFCTIGLWKWLHIQFTFAYIIFCIVSDLFCSFAPRSKTFVSA